MAITIGDAILWVRGKDDKLQSDLQGTEGKAKTILGRIAGNLKESMNVALGQVMARGMEQLASGIERMATETVRLGMEYGKQVEDIARLSGASVEDASRIIQVADDMKVEYGELSTALRMYAKTQSDNGQATELSIDMLASLSDEYLQLAPGIQRTNFLLQNFGRGGLAMGKMMEQGGASIREMSASVEDSLVLTKEGVQAANDYYKALDDWEDGIKGVKLQLAMALMPVLQDFLEFAKNSLVPAIQAVVSGFKALPEPVRFIVIALGGLVVALVNLGPLLMGIAGIAQMLGSGGVLAGVGTALAAISAPVWALIAALIALIATIVIFGRDALATIKLVATMWPQILVASFNRIIYELKRWINNFINNVRTLSKLTLQEWVNLGKALPGAILSGIKAGWNALVDGVKGLIDDLLKEFDLQLEIKSPSRVFMRRGELSAQGYGLGFVSEMTAQMRQQAILPATLFNSGTSYNMGQVEFHGTLTATEKRLLFGSVEDHTQRELLRALKTQQRRRR